MLKQQFCGSSDIYRSGSEMTVKYPRVLVIKAAFCLLKDGKSIEHRDLEKRYRPCYRDKHRRSLGAHFSPSCLR